MSTPELTPFAGKFAPLVGEERKLLSALTGSGPLLSIEAENEKEGGELLQTLVADAGAPFVRQQLRKSHKIYQKALNPRRKVITDRREAIRAALKKASRSLKQAAARAEPNLASVITTQLDEAYKQLQGAGKGVDSHLNAILRRGKLERVSLEALHAAILLAVFTFGFEWIGDSVCGWAARLIGVQQLPQRECVGLWFVATLTLFAAERWFLGPHLDGWLEERVKRSTLKELGLYYVERTRLEYRLAILESLTATEYKKLQDHGLL